MTTENAPPNCFNCQRTDADIPVIAWHFQGRPLVVCSECMPLLIHKWPQVAAVLAERPVEEAG